MNTINCKTTSKHTQAVRGQISDTSRCDFGHSSVTFRSLFSRFEH